MPSGPLPCSPRRRRYVVALVMIVVAILVAVVVHLGRRPRNLHSSCSSCLVVLVTVAVHHPYRTMLLSRMVVVAGGAL